MNLYKASLLGLLFMLIYACSTPRKVNTLQNQNRNILTNFEESSCKPGIQLSWKDKLLLNNQWGKYKVKKGEVKLCVHTFPENRDTLFGWDFQMPKKSYGVVAYPAIKYGVSTWMMEPKVKNTVHLKDLQQFEIDYKALLQTDGGKMNLAADIWIMDSEFSYRKAIHTELMIWEYADRFKANGKKIGELNTSEGKYYLQVGEINRKKMGLKWQYIAFIRAEERTEGVIPVQELLKYLVKEGYIQNDYYISSIEFGTELSNAEGSIYFTKYDLNLL